TYDYDHGVSIDSYALVLNVLEIGGSTAKVLGSPVTVTVNPPAPLPTGTAVSITSNGPAGRAAFVQGMVTPGPTVTVAGNVDLDLTGIGFVPVAPGVTLRGDRSVNPSGPRLFTRTFMRWLLAIGNDNVHITGIRFDGGEGDEATAYAGLPFDED